MQADLIDVVISTLEKHGEREARSDGGVWRAEHVPEVKEALSLLRGVEVEVAYVCAETGDRFVRPIPPKWPYKIELILRGHADQIGLMAKSVENEARDNDPNPERKASVDRRRR